MNQLILVLALSLFFSGTATAGENLPRAFACVMPTGAVTDFAEADFERDKDGLGAFLIAAIDPVKKTAQLVGRAGAADLVLIRGQYNLSFVEVTPAGNTTMTSVFPHQLEGNNFKAVHSRHMASATGVVVSQYYGTCEGKW